jgi:hypothetical protein
MNPRGGCNAVAATEPALFILGDIMCPIMNRKEIPPTEFFQCIHELMTKSIPLLAVFVANDGAIAKLYGFVDSAMKWDRSFPPTKALHPYRPLLMFRLWTDVSSFVRSPRTCQIQIVSDLNCHTAIRLC